MVLQQDLFTSVERRRIYTYVCAVVFKALIGVCIYIAVAKYISDIHALDSDRSVLSIILLVIALVWLTFTLCFASSLLGCYAKRISAFAHEKKVFPKFERHVFFWTTMLLFAALCFSNPMQLGIYAAKLANPSWSPSFLLSTIPSFACETIFFTSLMFYGWLMVHGLRLEEDWSVARFYLPKLTIIGSLILSKFVAAIEYRLYLSSLPFASFFSMLKISSISNPSSISSLQSRIVLATTFLEMAAIGAIAYDFARTNKHINEGKNRVKTIRFRFFIHRFGIIMTGMYLGYMGLSFFLKSGSLAKSLRGHTKSTFLILTRQEAMMVFMAYSLIEAFLNLPGRKYRLFFLRPLEESMVTHPVTYTDHEGTIEDRKHLFVCERNVELLNFNFVSYFLNSPNSEPPFDVKQALEHEGYSVFAKTSPASLNSSRAFVFTSKGQSKIVVCVIGPSDFQPRVMPGQDPQSAEASMECIFDAQQKFSNKEASVHHGFVLMYSEIATELNNIVSKALQEFNAVEPTLLFSGHSLGGALATLASIDIAIRHDLPPNRVITEIFGAPRIGNEAFASFYNHVVPLHWRVITDGDIVPQLPGTRYFPVGLDAVFTDKGQLVLDPTPLMSPRVRNGKGLSRVEMAARHKRISYLLAMQSWTTIHRASEYKSKTAKRLWSWPVQPEEKLHLADYGLDSIPGKVV